MRGRDSVRIYHHYYKETFFFPFFLASNLTTLSFAEAFRDHFCVTPPPGNAVTLGAHKNPFLLFFSKTNASPVSVNIDGCSLAPP